MLAESGRLRSSLPWSPFDQVQKRDDIILQGGRQGHSIDDLMFGVAWMTSRKAAVCKPGTACARRALEAM
jgi:hypothetical protein